MMDDSGYMTPPRSPVNASIRVGDSASSASRLPRLQHQHHHSPSPSPINNIVRMPEIGEIARIVNRLTQHLVGKTISKVTALEDAVVFKDTTHTAFAAALKGKKVLAAKRWGKYFWYYTPNSLLLLPANHYPGS